MTITNVTGIERIESFYIQLLYRCNYACDHCFLGENLRRNERLTRRQVEIILGYFHKWHAIERVVFLGGEPFLHPELSTIVADAHERGLMTEICTNGHGMARDQLDRFTRTLDKLRVSLDGLGRAHDAIRKPGAFVHAIKTIRLAVKLGIVTGVTMTVTNTNVRDLPRLVDLLAGLGVVELKLHQLRLVGNAARSSRLAPSTASDFAQSLGRCAVGKLRLVLDDSLLESVCMCLPEPVRATRVIPRIELSPDGGLTMSCKAVGRDAQAFRWDFPTEQVRYAPSVRDELQLGIPDVHYVEAG